jgi:hypothetical protein
MLQFQEVLQVIRVRRFSGIAEGELCSSFPKAQYRVSKKTILLRFFGENFFQKLPIRGIFMREINCTH